MTEPLNEKQIDQLIADYLANALSEADRPIFEDWLRASPANPRRVARLSLTDYAMREVCQDTKADYLLDVLNEIDDAAGPVELVTLHNLQPPSWQRYRLPMAIGIAIAAVLVLAITLIFTMRGPASNPASIANNTPVDPIAPRDPGLVGPALNNPVATLTATHNAQWAEGASAPGFDLHAGQRLTLTAGFAEITTNRGAVAILEAPATIELLDNGNALHLHTGKLVGICETDSSKGFLVRTAHLDITDLGTRFGVTSQNERVETTVFVGEVLVRTFDGQTRRLYHSQTASLALGGDRPGLMIESKVENGYTHQLPRPDLVTDAAINLEGYALRIVPQGMREDAKIYIDRDYQFNGIDETGLPSFLIGGDLVMLAGDARPDLNPAVAEDLRVEIEVSRPADVYLLIERSKIIGPWLERDYEKTRFLIGNDRVSPRPNPESLGIGPGVSIDRHFEVWKRKQPVTGRSVVGESIDKTMYAIVAVPFDTTGQTRATDIQTKEKQP